MFAKLCAKRNKKGFTLAELLIVVAIIAILVAIAIPVFKAQLDSAQTRVDEANMRSASSMAVAADLLDNEGKGGTYTYSVDTKHNLIEGDSGSPKFTVKVAAGGSVESVTKS